MMTMIMGYGSDIATASTKVLIHMCLGATKKLGFKGSQIIITAAYV